MNMQALITQCKCGGIVPPTLLWVGANNSIIVEGICMGCGEKVQAMSGFTQLNKIASALRGERKPLVPPLAPVDDKQWLHEMGVSID